MYSDACPPTRLLHLMFCCPVYVRSLYRDAYIPPVSSVTNTICVYCDAPVCCTAILFMLVICPPRCSTLRLSAAILFTLTACIVMFAPFCLRCSPVFWLYILMFIYPLSLRAALLLMVTACIVMLIPLSSLSMQLSLLVFLSFTFVCHLK